MPKKNRLFGYLSLVSLTLFAARIEHRPEYHPALIFSNQEVRFSDYDPKNQILSFEYLNPTEGMVSNTLPFDLNGVKNISLRSLEGRIVGMTFEGNRMKYDYSTNNQNYPLLP